jgi:hypothetical protein
MRRLIAVSILALSISGYALAAGVFKITFPDVTYSDGRVGTIQASVKTTRNGSVTVCGYFSDPNDQYLGQFEGTDNFSTDALVVKEYCEGHFVDRTPKK